MKNPVNKLFLVFSIFLANLFAVPLIGNYAMHLISYPIFTLFIVMLPLYILSSKDALEFISNPSKNSIFKNNISKKTFVWLIACLPVFAFGVLGVVIGTSIILWVLYNVFVERQPEFIVPALVGGFGMGPAILLFGLYCLKLLLVPRKSY